MSPSLALWITQYLGIETRHIDELALRSSKDREIFDATRESGVVVVTKDRDFRELLERLGSRPSVIWITCGNTLNARLIEIPQCALPSALELLEQGESLVEISDANQI
ncbi:MAG: DUF5615 family PIN-like protein [Dehalococcoidia bacterium]